MNNLNKIMFYAFRYSLGRSTYNINDEELYKMSNFRYTHVNISDKIDNYIINLFKDKWTKAIIVYIGVPNEN